MLVVALVLSALFFGFQQKPDAAIPAVDIYCPCQCKFCACPPVCEMPGTTAKVATTVRNNFRTYMNTARITVNTFISNQIDNFVAAVLRNINRQELALIDWWEVMWHYDLKPSLQDMTAQIGGVTTADQARTLGSFTDSQMQNTVQTENQKQEFEDHRQFMPSPYACEAATNVAGGGGRAVVLAKSIREARERERGGNALNKAGSVGANGSGAILNAKWDDYTRVYCNAASNNGNAGCATSGKFPDADINVARDLYNQLTIDVKTDADRHVALDAMTENLVGPIVADPIAASSLGSAGGQEKFLMRRSYLARKDAAHAIPNIVSSWRMPGGRVGTWLSTLRTSAGVPLGGISATNPSYREIMHAMVVDRFFDGDYGVGLIDEPANIEREKLVQQTLYLMQLRDYYELLERMALVLAVQVATQLDHEPAYSRLNDLTPVQ